jgi:hypothetical protein
MGKDGKTVTEAQKRATANYERKNYDKILLRLKKGTKEKIIKKIGENASVNGYITDLINKDLEAF